MKQASDKATSELPGLPRKRGRPPTGQAMTPAERQRKFRETHDLVTLTVELPSDLVEQFNDFLKFKARTKNEVIATLLKSQLLRKR